MSSRLPLALALAAVVLGAACSSKTGTGVAPVADAGARCDPAKCDPGNECLSDGTDVQCRRPCEAHTGPKSCAFNWICAKPEGAEKAFCRKTTLELTQKPAGQWGAHCTPQGGIKNNPDCDAEQGFWCYGESPTDADALCTQYGCQLDSDCGPGMWCAKINQSPSVATLGRSYGKTLTVCKPRKFCAECTSDIDCAPLGGVPQLCVLDAKGERRFCSQGCTSDSNCQLDATCLLDPDLNQKVCFPRAGVCKGDGSLCSPCRSDDDCPNGLCATQQFSPEKWCTVKSSTPCDRPKCTTAADCRNNAACTGGECQVGAVLGTCPKAPVNSAVAVACSAAPDDADLPKDHCYGLVVFGGDSYNIGCWTRAR